ncbi:hypothetical protein B0682_05875 [Moraxella lincolnii]|uniref:Uncharacterized protein n=1 Tax=Lwoffella lincolnii TaxID=90241 RepID=A0A1T0CE92_9GAMM|nr:hypothetical protein B0682_05875 [Moraxella lincolnii]
MPFLLTKYSGGIIQLAFDFIEPVDMVSKIMAFQPFIENCHGLKANTHHKSHIKKQQNLTKSTMFFT